MFKLDNDYTSGTIIYAVDKESYNAHHMYVIGNKSKPDAYGSFATIQFQKGPIRDCGVNGCTEKDLLNILKHR